MSSRVSQALKIPPYSSRDLFCDLTERVLVRLAKSGIAAELQKIR